jgi:transcriptional regulator
VLVIFAEPHAYISPKYYKSEQSVPTWNYITVHAYGNAIIVEDTKECFTAMEDMIKVYEDEYLPKWNQLPETFKFKMLNGIVVFKIFVTALQAKKKISQNKSLIEREKIITVLSTSTDPSAQHIAEYMQADFTKPY